MNDEAQAQLRRIVDQFGRDAALDVRRCEGLLRDLCSQFQRELNVLLAALRAGVAQEIIRSPVASRPTLAARLARRLEDDFGMAADAARWAVDAWVFALADRTTGTSSPSGPSPDRGGVAQLAENAGIPASRRSRVAERVERLLDEAVDLEHRAEWSAAVDVYDDVLAMDPGHAEAQSLRAAAVRRRDRDVSAGPASVQPAFQPASAPAPPDIAPPPLPRTVAAPVAPKGYVQIPPGQFTMGSPPTEEGRRSDEVRTLVTITRSFWLKATPVTEGEYMAIMRRYSSLFKRNCPVQAVSWHKAVAYLNVLSDREGLPRAYDANGRFAGLDSRGYRLPTEAEWEYACRAGCSAAQYGDLEQVAWYSGNSGNKTHPVRQKLPNAWGLYDMLGNVWEWTNDWNLGDRGGAVTDPVGPTSGRARVYRGGSIRSDARSVRAANRDFHAPDRDEGLVGFRPARSL